MQPPAQPSIDNKSAASRLRSLISGGKKTTGVFVCACVLCVCVCVCARTDSGERYEDNQEGGERGSG